MNFPASPDFWSLLASLVAASEVVIDRPRGSHHPRYPAVVYPLDYGYLRGTQAGDGDGIDVWRGTLPDPSLTGIVCTVDTLKRDTEIKVLLGCTPDEAQTVLAFQSWQDAGDADPAEAGPREAGKMAAMLIPAPVDGDETGAASPPVSGGPRED